MKSERVIDQKPHDIQESVLIDGTLARFETVYAAAGSAKAIFAVPYETLVEITGGSVADLAKE